MFTDSKNNDYDYLIYLFTINLICNLIAKYNKDDQNLNYITSQILADISTFNTELIISDNLLESYGSKKQILPVLPNNFETKCFIFTVKTIYLFCHKAFKEPSSFDLFQKINKIIFNNKCYDNAISIVPNITDSNIKNINKIKEYFICLEDDKTDNHLPIDNKYFCNSFTVFKKENKYLIGINSAYTKPLNFTCIYNDTINIIPPDNQNIISLLVFLLKLSKNTDNIKSDILGKNGLLTEATKVLGTLNFEDRKVIGKFLNSLKSYFTNIFDLLKKELEYINVHKSLSCNKIDVTLPTYNISDGGLHPLTQVIEDVTSIFNNVGFQIVEGPEIEIEEYNFTALNFDEHHPAKNSHDTFYFSKRPNEPQYLLRTHTSTVQIRTMKTHNLPLKFIVPGRVYRSDSDATHTPMFHQLEGLFISTDASIAGLKGLLIEFCEKFFNIKNVPLRFRPSYFPFTSPSLEVDIGCKITKDNVIIGKGEDWLEILGCGMVHPNVLKNCNIDSKIYNGFAFGMGLERLTMLKYGFPDIRDFFNSNYLWLKTYKFNVIKSLYKNLNS